jgi:hypothetical protein
MMNVMERLASMNANISIMRVKRLAAVILLHYEASVLIEHCISIEIDLYNIHELYISSCAQVADNAMPNALYRTSALSLYKCAIWLAW